MWEIHAIQIPSFILLILFITHYSKKKNLANVIREHSTRTKFLFFFLLYSFWVLSLMPIIVLTNLIEETPLSLMKSIVYLIMPFLCFFTISNYEYIFNIKWSSHYLTTAQLVKVVLANVRLLLFSVWLTFMIATGIFFFIFINGAMLWIGIEEMIGTSGGIYGLIYVVIEVIAALSLWKSLKFDGNSSLDD